MSVEMIDSKTLTNMNMDYSEKVLISGTAHSFLLYDCINANTEQEGFFIGNFSSELTNHISDSGNDRARLDTQISITTVLPLPAVSLFYTSTGKLKEDWLKQFMSTAADNIVGWYKYKKNSDIKPTLREKVIAKELQNYFDKYHHKKTFVSCFLSDRSTVLSSTHTYLYRFGKINSFNKYQHIEEVMGNLGEKLTGYVKPRVSSSHSVYNSIVEECNLENIKPLEAILVIQDAVNRKLKEEAVKAAEYEFKIREVQEIIGKINKILCDKQTRELRTAYNDMLESQRLDVNLEMNNMCTAALDVLLGIERETGGLNSAADRMVMAPTPSTPIQLNYAAALRLNAPSTTTSDQNDDDMEDDLIIFDDDTSDRPTMPLGNQQSDSRSKRNK